MASDEVDAAWAMDELWRYAHDPDMLTGNVARWAYDYIRELQAAVLALGAPLPPLGGLVIGSPPAGTQAPIRARWRTGTSVVPRVTLYCDDQIAGLALTAELAAEIVARCNQSDAR